jgi:hypothetical protein
MRAGEQDLLSSRGHALVHRRSVRAHAYLLTRQSACSVARRNATRGSTRRTKEVCSHRRRRHRHRRVVAVPVSERASERAQPSAY